MRRRTIVLCCLWAAVACSRPAANEPPEPAATAVLFEGALLIPGDGGAPIEDSAFVGENGRVINVGKEAGCDRRRARLVWI